MSTPVLDDPYDPAGFFDEVFDAAGQPRPGAEILVQRLRALGAAEVLRRQRSAERALLHLGITFNVYGDGAGIERIFPFDIVPRIVERSGVGPDRARPDAADPRAQPLHRRRLPRPADPQGRRHPRRAWSGRAQSFRPQCVGLDPPQGIWCHITGTDLVRDGDGQFYVLEDNLRCPSGVSYVLENRQVDEADLPAGLRGARASARSTTTRASCSTLLRVHRAARRRRRPRWWC